jgi:hypothetical protein
MFKNEWDYISTPHPCMPPWCAWGPLYLYFFENPDQRDKLGDMDMGGC